MKNTVATLQQQKLDGDKITMLTAYDYSTAKLVDECGVNTILVGDSLGMVMLGYEDTISVTMEDLWEKYNEIIEHRRSGCNGRHYDAP